MIKSFKHKGLKLFFEKGVIKGIQSKHSFKLQLVLDVLDSAVVIEDINFPGSCLHKLESKNRQIWSVKVSGNWRITFKFEEGNVYIVDYLDYH